MNSTSEYTGYDNNFSLDGKIAVITGGAAGIGLAIAELFIAKGARVALLDRADSVIETAASLTHAMGIPCDITCADSVTSAIDNVVQYYGTLDIVVNCAGMVALSPAESLSEADWDNTMNVNLKGTFLVCQCAGKLMLKNGHGKIINLASQAGVIALPEHAAYCASKAAIIGLTKVLALEWSPKGIQTNAISPTIVLTELGKKAWSGVKADAMKQKIPTRRFAYPDEIAACALFLASDASDMISGHNLVIDGGYSIQ
ncbi:SDR family oxidoreductase [Moellerella wisconsensis]|uniref:D-threitol dehydrogenase n=2 Tax=Moellerella wisconsensis TaxID=158849 RepID=A0ACD3YCP8_9GAMM|nr:D-threitol dehydrogenase [Moellerella wisconsensis]KLN97367.1 short-chain dehydrogenase [Moellerella wisconsensis]UNH25436.1 D-threitol dehydrogenase [Moellerella wisconsensis]UNH28621.1 D-threitol dehydrogenase [Moellerella wisconsensis]UNH32074.1 D-threitol dehydrogenase [Moellerella wisconsensis]UNH40229.1 D-threitol dehydrogenase [Moellerella wisconsensis]